MENPSVFSVLLIKNILDHWKFTSIHNVSFLFLIHIVDIFTHLLEKVH
ncbi:hypothetical protein BN000_03239 [Neobacillus massiliamazoniensis]|uniref:Uncharacterized protein n=1 Tax=Neobacillus massiliamazoniensis TaxID=1499688 RepID=A0A0U1NZ67_9BACI|nr:hypothetical protein BN000_03239 [Neobacillus massiliamazoniensis]